MHVIPSVRLPTKLKDDLNHYIINITAPCSTKTVSNSETNLGLYQLCPSNHTKSQTLWTRAGKKSTNYIRTLELIWKHVMKQLQIFSPLI